MVFGRIRMHSHAHIQGEGGPDPLVYYKARVHHIPVENQYDRELDFIGFFPLLILVCLFDFILYVPSVLF